MANATVNLNITKTGYVKKTNPYTVYKTNASTSYIITNTDYNDVYMYFSLPDFPSSIKHNALVNAKLVAAFQGGDGDRIDAMMCGDFDPETLTFANRPTRSKPLYFVDFVSVNTGGTLKNLTSSTTTDLARIQEQLRNKGLYFGEHVYSSSSKVYMKTVLANGTSKPYLTVTYDDATKAVSKITYKSGPKAGYKDPRSAVTFGWDYEMASTGIYCASDEWDQSSAVFHWKSSSDQAYTDINVSGNTKSIEIPANTFPVGETIQWYVTGTDEDNTVSSTPVYTFSTSASQIVATAKSPINSIEENNAPILFSWTLSSSDGFSATNVSLKWRVTGASEWTDLTQISGHALSYEAPADTFPSGSIDWMVVADNIDGETGVSSSASFISYGAPEAPILDIVSVPFMTVSWQANEQKAYEIIIDTKHYGPYFGEDKTFSLPDYLEDGEHSVEVRIMGAYNLWSLWSKETITIHNEPGTSIRLVAEVYDSASLRWTANNEAESFYVYRNGIQIAHTGADNFTDRLSNGEVEFFVVGRLSSGNYTKSNVVQKTVKVDCLHISETDGTNHVKVLHTLKDTSDPQYDLSKAVSYAYTSNRVYEYVYESEFLERTIGYSAVFLFNEKEAEKKFVALFGKPVIVKFPDGWCGVCYIDNLQYYPRKEYYRAYTFTLKQVDWEDYFDDTE